MQPSSYFVDTNLLVLFVVGNVDSSRIPRHNRTRAYTVDDFKKLSRMLADVKQILVTPNILTETNNLLDGDERMAEMLRKLICTSYIKEIYVKSRMVVERDEFRRLGLTDCGLLEVITPETPLLSDDFDLTRTALKLNSHMAISFNVA